MPDLPIAPRADPTPTNHWVTIIGATYTSTILLGETPAATPPPTASSSPSRATVIGAVVGSIFGFLFLLFLVWAFVRTSRSNWVPHKRGYIDEVYVAHPNVAPVVVQGTTVTTTKVIIEKTETSHRFMLVRPSTKRERPPVEYSESSESSMSSDHS